MTRSTTASAPRRTRRRTLLLGGTALAGAAMVAVNPAYAAPDFTGGTTVTGAGTPASQPDITTGAATTVVVNDPRTIITWNTYNVAAGETVAYTMANSDIVVNRTLANSPITIGGAVSGAGHLWFLSSGGVFVNGAGSITAANNGIVMSNGVLTGAMETSFLSSGSVNAAFAVIANNLSYIQLLDLPVAVDAEIQANGDIVLNSTASATGNFRSRTGNADITVVNNFTQNGGSAAFGDITIDAGGAYFGSSDVGAGNGPGGSGDLTITAGSVGIGSASANRGAVSITADTTATIGASFANTGITIAAGGAVSLNSFDFKNNNNGGGSGDITVTGASVNLNGSQFSNGVGNVTITGPANITGTVASSATGTTRFTSTVDGTGSLGVTGAARFDGLVGDTTPLASLSVGGLTTLNAASIETSGSMSLLGGLTFGSGAPGTVALTIGDNLTAGAIAAINTDTDLTLTANTMSLTDVSLGGSGSSVTVGGGAITLSGNVSAGDVTFANPLVLSGSGVQSITGTNSATFDQISSSTGTQSLRVGTLGAATFNGPVGLAGIEALLGLAVQADTVSFQTGNHVSNFAANINSGGLTFDNDQALTISTVVLNGVAVGAGDVTFDVDGDLTLAKVVAANGAGAVLTLNATGSVAQTSGEVTTTTLQGASAGGFSLTLSANDFTTLGNVTNTGGGGITVVDGGALNVTGALAGGTGSITLTAAGLTTGALTAAQDLTLNATTGVLGVTGDATATAGSVSLGGTSINVSGTVQSGTDVFATATTGNASLNVINAGRDANLFATQGTLSANTVNIQRNYSANAQDFLNNALNPTFLGAGTDWVIVDTSGGLVFDNKASQRTIDVTAQGGDLTVSNLLSASGDIKATTTGGGNIIVAGDLTTLGAGRDMSFNSSGTVTQTGGRISTDQVSGSSVGGFSLNRAGNIFASLGALTNTGSGDVTLVDSVALDLTSAVSVTGSFDLTAAGISFTTLTASQDLTLNGGSGNITGDTATATAGNLSITTTGVIHLDPADAGGDVILSGGRVEVGGAVTAGRDVIVTATDADTGVAGGEAIRLANATGSVSAGRDISLTASSTGTAAFNDGGSIITGGLAAGADVAISVADQGVVLGSVAAGDDVAIRVSGQVGIVGTLASGRDFTGVTITDASGAADSLTAGSVFPDFDPGIPTPFTLAGHDIDVRAGGLTVTGAITAGLQSPAGGVDTTPSDVRLRTDIGSLQLGAVTATRDIQLDGVNGLSASDLLAGRDVAVLGRGNAGVTIGSATAGQHVVAYSIGGRVHFTGQVQAGADLPGLQPDSASDPIDSAGQRLAAYINYLDLDDATQRFVAGPGDIMVRGAGADFDAGATAAGAIRVRADNDINTAGTISAAGEVVFDGAVVTGEGFSSTNADVAILARSGSIATGVITAQSGDVALSSAGDIGTGTIFAGDDLVLRAGGAIDVAGALRSGENFGDFDTGVTGRGDALAGGLVAGNDLDASSTTIRVSGDVRAGRTGVISATDTNELGSDVRVVATGDDGLGPNGEAVRLATGAGRTVTAAQDITLRTTTSGVGSIVVGTTATPQNLIAGQSVTLLASGGNITVGAVSAGDDIVARADLSGTITTGALATGRDFAGVTIADANGNSSFQDFDGTSPFILTGHDIDIQGGTIVVASATAGLQTPGGGVDTTASDVRLRSGTGALQVGAVTANRDIQLDSALGASVTGALTGYRDIGVLARNGALDLTSASAGRHTVLFSQAGAVHATGQLSSGAADAAHAPDSTGDIASGSGERLANFINYLDLDDLTQRLVSGPGDVMVRGADVALDGGVAAEGAVRVRSDAAITTGAAVTADGEVVFDAATNLTGGQDFTSSESEVALYGRTGNVVVGAVSAAGDAALKAGGSISSGAVSAGDDAVLRAGTTISTGALTATGGTNAAGRGDDLFATDPSVLNGNLSVAGGLTVDLRSAGGITVSGATNADGAARFQTAGAAADIVLAAVTAGQDVLVDAGGNATTGVLSAGRDVGARARNGALTIGGASAGDDIVLRGVLDVTVNGALTSTAGADSAAAQQAGDEIAAADPTTLVAALDSTGRNIDVRSFGGVIAVTGTTNAAGDARFQTAGSGTIDVANVTAGQNVLLDGAGVTAGDVTATNSDVAVRSRGSSAGLGVVTAGDDVVIRAGGGLTVTSLSSTATGDTAGLGDALIDPSEAGAFSFQGQDFDLAGSDIDVTAESLTATAAGSTSGTGSDVRVQTVGSITVADLTAGRDLLLNATVGGVTAGALTATRGDVAVQAGPLAAITLGGATAGDDVVLRTTGAVSVTGDVKSAQNVVDGDTGATGVADLLAGALVAGNDIDISAASVDVAGDVRARRTGAVGGGDVNQLGSDVRVTATGVDAAGPTGQALRLATGLGKTVTAVRDVDLSASAAGTAAAGDGGSVFTGAITAGRDLAAGATDGNITVGTASAGDDLVLRGINITAGGLTADGGSDAAGAADTLFATAPSDFGGAFDLVGANVDVKATGTINVSGASTAGRDARFIAPGSVQVASVTGGREVLLDGSSATATGTLLASGGDVAAYGRSGDVSVGGATAGDDVVLRASGSVSAGTLDASGSGGGVVGDRLIGQAGAVALNGQSFNADGGVVDVRGTSVDVGGATAGGDVRLQATGGDVSVGAVDAGSELLLDATGGIEATGGLTAGGDAAINAGGAASLGSVDAGDDIVLRATGGLTAGALTAQGSDQNGVGDLLATGSGALSVGGQTFTLTGATVDVRGANVTTGGILAGGDARVQATAGGATVGAVTATTGDVLVDATGAARVNGDVRAGRDAAVRSTTSTVTVAGVSAGDDVVLRASGAISAGVLSAQGGADANGVGDLVFNADKTALNGDFDLAGANVDVKGGSITATGTTTAGRDARFQSRNAAGAVQVAAVTAGRDVLLDGLGVTASGAITATAGDVAAWGRTGGVTTVAVTAGDDVVVRTPGAVTTGALRAGTGADATGAADRLVTTAGAMTVNGQTFGLTGGAVDVRGASLTVGQVTAGSDARLQATAGAASSGAVTAGQDVLVDATGAVTASGNLQAGRDAGVRSTGSTVTLAGVSAGDDVVLRASGALSAGALSAQGGADANGAGDLLFNADRTALNGDFDLAGANVDAKGGSIAVTGATTAGRDARLQSAGAVQVAAVTAGRDVLLDGASATGGALVATAGDVAVRSRTGAVQIASAQAGDDVAIRAATTASVAGALASNVGTATTSGATGAADRLLTTAGQISWQADPAAAAITSLDVLAGRDVDVRAGGAVTVSGAASGANLRIETPGTLSLAAVTGSQLIFTRASGLTIGGNWAAPTVRIEATTPAGLVLGNGVTAPAGALVLTSEQLNRLDANTVQIFAGSTANTVRGAGLTIGTLNVDVSRIRTALELYAGPSADVIVSRTIAPSSEAANSLRLRIGAPSTTGSWTPRNIKVIADNGGAIGASATNASGRTFTGVRAFGSVELNATDNILAGFQAYIDAMESTPAANVAARIRTLAPAPQTGGVPAMLITAGNLSLRANGKVATQDTSTQAAQTRTGVYLTGSLQLGRVSAGTGGSATPEFIELYGAMQNGPTLLANEGASLSSLIGFADGVQASQFYRLNTCVILQQGACTPNNINTDVSIRPETSALSVVNQLQQGVGEDPTVASAFNEEIWRDPE